MLFCPQTAVSSSSAGQEVTLVLSRFLCQFPTNVFFLFATYSFSPNLLSSFHHTLQPGSLLQPTLIRSPLPKPSMPSPRLLHVPHSFHLSSSSSSSPSQRPVPAGTRCLPVSPQHQQCHRVRPSQLLPRGGHPQHIPRGPAAGCPGPAGLGLQRRARLPVAVARQQPGPQDARRHGHLQQVHLQVCAQVSEGETCMSAAAAPPRGVNRPPRQTCV